MGWLDRFTDESTASDSCIDCGTGISIPASRGRGMSRCGSCDSAASNIGQTRANESRKKSKR